MPTVTPCFCDTGSCASELARESESVQRVSSSMAMRLSWRMTLMRGNCSGVPGVCRIRLTLASVPRTRQRRRLSAARGLQRKTSRYIRLGTRADERKALVWLRRLICHQSFCPCLSCVARLLPAANVMVRGQFTPGSTWQNKYCSADLRRRVM
jgi:hypothetical protein